MKISIFKYNRVGNYQNYFDRTSTLTLNDKYVYNRQPLNSFPVFREEFSQVDDINVFKTGYFDLQIPLTMPEVSTTGKRISQFFENLDPTVNGYKFLVVCETNNAYRNYCGIVDLNSIKILTSPNDNKYHLYFSVIGIEAEYVQLLKESISPNLTADKIFETDFIQNVMTYWGDPDRISTVSYLNLYEKLGYHLTISKELFSDLLLNNLDPSGSVTNITSWNVFKSFMVGFGYRFKILCNNTDVDFPKFTSYLFFRSKGITSDEITKLVNEEKAVIFSGVDTIGMFHASRTDGSNADILHKQGFIMTKSNIYITNSAEDIQHNTAYGTYTFRANTINPVTFKEDAVQIINLDLYDANLNAGDIAICKCVPGQDINPLITYLTYFEFQYLITGVKRKRNFKIKVSPESNISAGSKITYQSKHYQCERVNSYDPFNETMEVELVQA